MQEKPKRKARVQLLLLYKDKLLFLKNKNLQTGEVFWQLPGGGIKPGESPEEAILREAREEFGFKKGPLKLLDFARVEDESYEEYYTFLGQAKRAYTEPGQESNDYRVISDLDWVSLDTLLAYPFSNPEQFQPSLSSIKDLIRKEGLL